MSQEVRLNLDAPFVFRDLFDEMVVVIGQHALPGGLGRFPAEFYMAVVVGAFKILRWLAIVVHRSGIDYIVGVPRGIVSDGGFHMVVMGARTHELVIEIAVAFL